MPLVWAHAEYIKLVRSLHDGRVFDMPPQTVRRYQVARTGSGHTIWRFNHKCRAIVEFNTLRLEVLAPARVRWSRDEWRTVQDTETRDTGLGIHVVDFPTSDLRAGHTVRFTFYWPEAERWEGRDFEIQVVARTSQGNTAD